MDNIKIFQEFSIKTNLNENIANRFTVNNFSIVIYDIFNVWSLISLLNFDYK